MWWWFDWSSFYWTLLLLCFLPGSVYRSVNNDPHIFSLLFQFGLRQLDLSLLSQLWALNESIQELRMMQEQEVMSPPSPSQSISDGNSISSGDEEGDSPIEAPITRMRTAPPPPPVNRPKPMSATQRPVWSVLHTTIPEVTSYNIASYRYNQLWECVNRPQTRVIITTIDLNQLLSKPLHNNDSSNNKPIL